MDVERRDRNQSICLQCPICLDSYDTGEGRAPMQLYCGHSVCEECAPRLPGKYNHVKCPVCADGTTRLPSELCHPTCRFNKHKRHRRDAEDDAVGSPWTPPTRRCLGRAVTTARAPHPSTRGEGRRDRRRRRRRRRRRPRRWCIIVRRALPCLCTAACRAVDVRGPVRAERYRAAAECVDLPLRRPPPPPPPPPPPLPLVLHYLVLVQQEAASAATTSSRSPSHADGPSNADEPARRAAASAAPKSSSA